jgi:hypothetical protein
LSLFQHIPGNDERVEIGRFMTSNEHAKGMLDTLAQVLNHYPERPAPKP